MPIKESFTRTKTVYLGIACSLALSVFSHVNAADAPGSPGNPLTYEGTQPEGKLFPDGHLPFSPDVQNIQIYRCNRKPSDFFDGGPGYTYSHHMDMGAWKGLLYAAWDITLKDEDTLPTRLLYATSDDGFHWSEPKDLFPPGQGWNLRFYFYHASNDTMLAFAAAPRSPEAKKISESKKPTIYVREIDANHQLGPLWTLLKPRHSDPPSFEKCPDAKFVDACREAINNRPLLEQEDYGQLLGDRAMKWHNATNWPGGKIGGMSKYWSFGKAMCFYHRQDGTLVSLCKLGFVSISSDGGDTWSFPVIPDGLVTGTGKIWGQRTFDDRYALVYNPWTPGPRFPLVEATSDDGIAFHGMSVIHGEVPPERYRGSAKGDTGPQYIRGVAEWAGDADTIKKFEQNAMWLIYSINKEDIWISRVALPVAPDAPAPVHDTFDDLPVGPRVPNWHIYSPMWARVGIAKDPQTDNKYLELTDSDPVDYSRAIRTFAASGSGEISFRLQAGQADHGRMEIDLLGEHGTRPVQIALDDQGNLAASDGGQSKQLGTYSPNSWMKFNIQFKDGKFTLTRDGQVLLKDAGFAESSPTVYAISFRTGKYRATVTPMPTVDPSGTEDMVATSTYRIDDVMQP
ncbi:MAG TPA: hypothetical protein VK811_08750 [Candidatus Acidoferrum sp.]|jgi:hypothetical protein|nr:hypothetical protein [Candidatus Acidoferrum sp.]